MGAKEIKRILPHNMTARLGLSATPHRHFDESGTKVLMNFFNSPDKSTYQISIKEAQNLDCLCLYQLYPYFAHLTYDEYERYEELTKKIVRLIHINNNGKIIINKLDPQIESLLRQRKRLLNCAIGKLDSVSEIIDKIIEYNGTGRTYSLLHNQISLVISLYKYFNPLQDFTFVNMICDLLLSQMDPP